MLVIALVVGLIWCFLEVSAFVPRDIFLCRGAVVNSVAPKASFNTEACAHSAHPIRSTWLRFRVASAPLATT